MDEDYSIREPDALLDGSALRSPPHDINHTHTGEFAVLVSTGGIDVGLATKATDEQEHLLSSQDGLHQTQPSSSSQDDLGDSGTDWNGMVDFIDLPWYRRPSLYWVLVPFLILAISYGGIIAPRVQLILNLTCREYYADQSQIDPGSPYAPILFDGTNNEQCRNSEVQSRASQFNLCGNLIGGLLSAVTSPKIGSLSDRYGRTKLITLTSLGSLLGEFTFILAAKTPETFNMNWILFGFALDGLCGSFTTAFAVVHAYVTDCVAPPDRSVAFAFFHGSLFTGLAVGPAISSFLTRSSGSPVTPFYVILVVHMLFMVFVGLIAPESLSKRRQKIARASRKRLQDATAGTSDWIDSLRNANLLSPLKVLWPTGPGSRQAIRMNLVILASIDTIMFGVAMGSMSVVLMYANFQFGWQTYESGIYMSIVNTFRVTCLILILPLITRLVRGRPLASSSIPSHPNSPVTSSDSSPSSPSPPPRSGADTFDLSLIRTAICFDTLGYIGYTLSPTGSLFTLSGVLASVGGIGSPTLQAALTKHVPQDRVGQLLGASGLLHALARVVAPTICNRIYSVSVGSMPQVIFVCLAATFAVAFGLSWAIKTGVQI